MEAKALSSIIFRPRIKPNGKVYRRKGRQGLRQGELHG